MVSVMFSGWSCHRSRESWLLSVTHFPCIDPESTTAGLGFLVGTDCLRAFSTFTDKKTPYSTSQTARHVLVYYLSSLQLLFCQFSSLHTFRRPALQREDTSAAQWKQGCYNLIGHAQTARRIIHANNVGDELLWTLSSGNWRVLNLTGARHSEWQLG